MNNSLARRGKFINHFWKFVTMTRANKKGKSVSGCERSPRSPVVERVKHCEPTMNYYEVFCSV